MVSIIESIKLVSVVAVVVERGGAMTTKLEQWAVVVRGGAVVVLLNAGVEAVDEAASVGVVELTDE